MREWIRFREKINISRYHLLIATHPSNGRMATACGRAFDYMSVLDQFWEGGWTDAGGPPKCTCCQRRIGRTTYLLPNGDRLQELLA